MHGQRGQQVAGVRQVVAQLRAAQRMGQGIDAVDAALEALAGLPGQALRRARHAADRAENPDFVADTDRAPILAQPVPAITHECARRRRFGLYGHRLVDIVLGAAQRRDHVVRVDVVAGLDGLRRLADNEAVLVHGFALGDGADGDLVALGHVAADDQAEAAHLDFGAGGDIAQGHADIVRIVHPYDGRATRQDLIISHECLAAMAPPHTIRKAASFLWIGLQKSRASRRQSRYGNRCHKLKPVGMARHRDHLP